MIIIMYDTCSYFLFFGKKRKWKKRIVQNADVTFVTHPKGVNNSCKKKVYITVFAYYSI